MARQSLLVSRRLERRYWKRVSLIAVRVDHRRLGDLHGVLGLPLVVGARCQVEIAHALIVQADAQFLIAERSASSLRLMA